MISYFFTFSKNRCLFTLMKTRSTPAGCETTLILEETP